MAVKQKAAPRDGGRGIIMPEDKAKKTQPACRECAKKDKALAEIEKLAKAAQTPKEPKKPGRGFLI